MKEVTELLQMLSQRLAGKAAAKAVAGTPISVGDCHVLPLCEVAVGFGGGGGEGISDGDRKGENKGEGTGGGGGGGSRVRPVAVLVVDGTDIRIERLG